MAKLFLPVLRFQCVPNNLTGPSDAFLIGVGVHPQRDRRVTMAQPFRYADHIGSVGDCEACGGVAELVRVEILNAVPLAELLKIAGGALGVHNVWAVFLRENVFSTPRQQTAFPSRPRFCLPGA